MDRSPRAATLLLNYVDTGLINISNSGTTIENCYLHDSIAYGVRLAQNQSNTIVSHNRVVNCEEGVNGTMYGGSVSGIEISGNILTNNPFGGVRLNNRLAGSQVVTGVRVLNNTISANNALGAFNLGIEIFGGQLSGNPTIPNQDVIVAENNVSGYITGISINACGDVVVSNNVVAAGSFCGIEFANSVNCTASSNNIDCASGGQGYSVSDNNGDSYSDMHLLITGGSIINGGVGTAVQTFNVNYVTVDGVYAKGAATSATFQDGNNVTVQNCVFDITATTSYGVALIGAASSAYANFVFRNNTFNHPGLVGQSMYSLFFFYSGSPTCVFNNVIIQNNYTDATSCGDGFLFGFNATYNISSITGNLPESSYFQSGFANSEAIVPGKTFTLTNTLTLSGVDGSTLNVGAGGTLQGAAFGQSGSVTDAMWAGTAKPSMAVVAVTNLTLSGEQTVDGQATSSSLVLATAQTTASQNGPWVSGTGSWTRPTWYSSGSATQAPQFSTTLVAMGNTYQGSVWWMTSTNVTIDTTPTTWVQIPTAAIVAETNRAETAEALLTSMLTFSTSLRTNGWSIIGNNPNHLHANGRNTNFISPSATDRLEVLSNTAVQAIRLVYANYWAGNPTLYGNNEGETPNTNQILVRAALELPQTNLNSQNYSYYPVTFSGFKQTWIDGISVVVSDPIQVPIRMGGRFYVRTYSSAAAQMSPPAQPSVTVSNTNGFLAAGTYQISQTFCYPSGYETPGSACTAATTTGSSSSILVTAPSAPSTGGAIGYRVYMGVAGAPATSNQYLMPGGLCPFSSNVLITMGRSLASPAIAGPQVSGGGFVGYPGGVGAMGGTGPNSANNGEGLQSTFDYTEAENVIPNNIGTSLYSPVAVLGLTPAGVQPSVAIEGDSIDQGAGDAGYGVNRGGWITRLLTGQVTSLAYMDSITPKIGFLIGAKSSDLGVYFATPYCSVLRTKVASFASHIICNYGTNDIYTGNVGSAQLAITIPILANQFINQGQYYFHSTLLPRTTSTDGFQTINHQTFAVSNLFEGYRRAFNNWIASSGAARIVTSEALFGNYFALGNSSTNMYVGGNGTATQFVSANPLKEGSETVYVNGTAQTAITNYSYLSPFASSIDGFTYASGITFTSAPATGASVTATYTTPPSLASWLSNNPKFLGIFDPASVIEVNASGTSGVNGGFWSTPMTTTGTYSSTVTSSTTSSITDTSLSLAQDAVRGYSILITADSPTPSLVGQTASIISNSANLLTFGSALTAPPDPGASYSVIRALTTDGIHPSSDGCVAIAISPSINIGRIKFQ